MIDILGTLTALYQFIVGLPGAISTIALYPIQAGISTVINIGGDFVGHVAGPIGPIIQLQAGMIQIIQAVLGNLFPLTWIGLITAGISTIVIIRLYHFVKDLEIAGFKI